MFKTQRHEELQLKVVKYDVCCSDVYRERRMKLANNENRTSCKDPDFCFQLRERISDYRYDVVKLFVHSILDVSRSCKARDTKNPEKINSE